MVTDPRFDVQPDEYTDPQKRRSKWASCLIGCLIILGVMLVVAILVAVWVSRNWRGWTADFGSMAMNQAIDDSTMPPQEKGEVKVQVERVATALRDGRIGAAQAGAIFTKVMDSPLMPTLVVAAIGQHYFEQSKLSDEEKTEGRQTLNRFARAIIDKKVDKKGIDAVMMHIADRRSNGRWQFRPQVSDEELRAALAEAKSQADAAGIAAEPTDIDFSEEFKRIIDEELPANSRWSDY